MRTLISAFVIISILLCAKTAYAVETLVFDSTDHYIGACRLTNKSSWELTKDIAVSKFQVWYKWNTGESSLPVTIMKDGEKFAEFESKRGGCDPYQTTWCNADYEINKTFPAGTYTTDIPDSRQCLKPGGTGTIRLYTNDTPATTPTITPTSSPSPTLTTQPTSTPVAVQTNPITTTASNCSCNQTTTIAASAAISSVLSIGISLFLRRNS